MYRSLSISIYNSFKYNISLHDILKFMGDVYILKKNSIKRRKKN